jgi:hypothetical protein
MDSRPISLVADLKKYYDIPSSANSAIHMAYLHAKTIHCESQNVHFLKYSNLAFMLKLEV